jgi:RNA polymerase sigma-70 factor (ECF subfamily)
VDAQVRPQLARPVDADNPEPLDFEDILRRHQAMVFSIAFHFLQDRTAAEELAQDVFLQLYRHLPGLQSAGHIMFWLRKVASHRCIDYARRRRLTFLSLTAAPEPLSEERARDPFLTRHVRAVVASLSYKARLIVILRYQEDLTPTEISDATGIPIATVKSQLQRALATLRDRLVRVAGDPRP